MRKSIWRVREGAKRAAKTTEDRAAASSRERKDRHWRLKNKERSGCRGCTSLIVRECMAVETEEQREARLQRANQSDRLAAETEEQRESRLQRMCANQSDKLAAETEEQREARMQRMLANQSERLAAETEQQKCLTRLQ